LLYAHNYEVIVFTFILLKFMRAIGKYYHSNDEFVHPLWLGTLILFIVMTIIGIICCLRIKCGSQLSHLLNRLFGRNNETNGKKGISLNNKMCA